MGRIPALLLVRQAIRKPILHQLRRRKMFHRQQIRFNLNERLLHPVTQKATNWATVIHQRTKRQLLHHRVDQPSLGNVLPINQTLLWQLVADVSLLNSVLQLANLNVRNTHSHPEMNRATVTTILEGGLAFAHLNYLNALECSIIQGLL